MPIDRYLYFSTFGSREEQYPLNNLMGFKSCFKHWWKGSLGSLQCCALCETVFDIVQATICISLIAVYGPFTPFSLSKAKSQNEYTGP